MKEQIKLGVNIDHVATLRQQRGAVYPDPVQAAVEAEGAGADGITLHLREDRRHIQDADLRAMKEAISIPINLEMAATDEMVDIACALLPEKCCLLPEKREELTTEGGLDVAGNLARIMDATSKLQAAGIEVSLFIEPDKSQIDASIEAGATVIEIHTGAYAEAKSDEERAALLKIIYEAACYAHERELIVNAGHGLYYDNVQAIAAIPVINELNIGHGIVAHSVFVGMRQAVMDMKREMLKVRKSALTQVPVR